MSAHAPASDRGHHNAAPGRRPASPVAFVRHVEMAATTDEWLAGDVDTGAILDEALAQLARTGAHGEQCEQISSRRSTTSTATLALEAVALLRDAIALRGALARTPLARSRALADAVPRLGSDGADLSLRLRAHVPGLARRARVTLRLARGDVLLVTDSGPLTLTGAMEAIDAIAVGTGLDRARTARELAALSRTLADLPHVHVA